MVQVAALRRKAQMAAQEKTRGPRDRSGRKRPAREQQQRIARDVKQQRQAAPGEDGEDEDGEELDIDLDNPEDVKVIHDEFQKLYDQDGQFRQSFG